MSTERLDKYAAVSCDGCGALSRFVEDRPGWRLKFAGDWLFYADGDRHLCPRCKWFSQFEAGSPYPPSGPAAEGP